MKERIVLEIPKDMCDNCNSCDRPISAQIECYLKEKRQVYETIKVPETFEELKTMCEELESQTMDVTCDVLKDEIDVTIWNIYRSYKVGFVGFYYDGDKVHLSMGTGFSIPIEIPKVWSFIKSLIGEE